MRKGDEVIGEVYRMVFPDKGIARVTEDGQEYNVKVKYALPGQKIRLRISKKKANNLEGNLLEVIEPAAGELKSDCPHFGQCGSCIYRTFPYEKQLEIKKGLIGDLFAPVLGRAEFDRIFEGIYTGPEYEGYRNKMEFTFGDEYKDGPLALGMHKRGNFYDIITTGGCRIVDEDYRAIVSFTLEYFKGKGLPFFHRVTHEGYLRHLCVRKAAKTGEILVALVTTSAIDFDLTEWADELRALPTTGTVVGILHTVNDSVADTVLDEGTTILYGRDYFYEELLGLKFKISQFSFFQTNSLGAEVLYSKVKEYLGTPEIPNPVVFDLYSGTGTIAQLVSPAAGKVVGVEIVEEAVEAAKVNADINGLTNCEFIAGDVLRVLDDVEEEPDYIILDPPRDGINPKALTKIIAYGVDRMVYVSCKPTSLARDMEVLKEAGYVPQKMCCVDMFPATVHVETVVLMSRDKE
ncbi:MAG: 23S rRNA (uracil(1939)-C(5))-methyltransferase RlmD [Lachnospiraceae bacterium]|nr:23S rRNA (uracil(1939)-C(5))-methyltransferase RlmD [Lachnospiraceae bacterium]